MPVSPVRPFSISTESTFAPDDKVTKPDAALSAPSEKPESQKSVTKTSAPANHKAQRESALRNSARAGRTGLSATTGKNAGAVWNAGLSLACELVQAAIASSGSRDESTSFSMRELMEMIQPLVPKAETKPPSAAAFIEGMIAHLKSAESPEQTDFKGAEKSDIGQ